MFSQIMVPVDLEHRGSLEKALEVAGDLARSYRATLHFVSVSGGIPTKLAHSAEDYGDKLDDFARKMGKKYGVTTKSLNMAAIDPTAEMDADLMKAVDQTGADLVVMASHEPGLMEYIFSSHAGHMASHAKVSVFVVR